MTLPGPPSAARLDPPPEYLAEADAAFRALRERAPVLPVRLPEGLTAWVITRYEDGRRALRNPCLIKDLRRLTDPGHGFAGRRYAEDLYVVEGRHMLNSDEADHARLRGVVAAQLSAEAVARRREEIESIALMLTDRLAITGEADLLRDYAQPLTETVLARVLGFPDEAMDTAAALTRRLGGRENPDSPPMRRAFADLVDLVRDAVSAPQQAGSGTVILALQQAVAEGRISRREMASTVTMLFGAGISSTAIAIGHGAATVMHTASTLRHLLADEGHSAALVEELLRHHPPFPFSPWRFALEPVEIGGTVIPAGAVVFILLASVNRDPAAFSHPDDLLLERPTKPSHLTFGHGPHYCVGAHLARLEIRVALRTLFGRFLHIRPALPYSEVTWRGLLFDRTPARLPVLTDGGAAREDSR
ncbi:cytochrome P450 [Streptomyces formicae]|uniref:Cytochrome P450 n=1 Tax=Streptomyces formicae TaxID=1616117 RepID=A0ABY3WGR2_9ACTN|nr:cytochrome P450 [Streptomyces formicae]UNM11774.1 cytochrome P450 [Streptomyces formicae]